MKVDYGFSDSAAYVYEKTANRKVFRGDMGTKQILEDAKKREALKMKQIVSVKYIKDADGTLSDMSYSYFTDVDLEVGDIIDVPVRDRWTKAMVTELNVPYSRVEAFADKLKTVEAKEKPVFRTEEEIENE